MLNIKNQTLLLSLAFLVTSCLEVIDFQSDETGGQLTIYGKITNSDLHDQSIRVSRATSDRNPEEIVENAVIEVIDDQDCVHTYFFDEKNGFYAPNAPYAGIPGRSYRARIQVDGQEYLSSFQKMPLSQSKDSTYFQFRRITTLSNTGGEAEAIFMQVFTDSEIPETDEPLFIRWDILQVYVQLGIILPSSNFPRYSPIDCYIEEPFIGETLKMHDGREVGPGTLQGQFMAETLLDESFNTLRGFGIVQNSITEEAFDYWARIEEVSNRVGSIFETPPAAIRGNITNVADEEDFALGFFEVARVDTTGTFVTPDDIPVFLGNGGNFILCNEEHTFAELFAVPFECFPCLLDIGVHPACINCTILNNSTRTRPSYLF